MTDIFKTPEKVYRRDRLFEIGIETLQRDGWRVERVAGAGKSSLRRIVRQGESHLVSIRTTQDQWIAFPRKRHESGWVTLDEVGVVLAVSVDDPHQPTAALVHWLEADDVRARFDRAYAARLEAGRSIPLGRGVWVALYIDEDGSTVRYVGGGAGNVRPPIARVALKGGDVPPRGTAESHEAMDDDGPLTIAEAKRRLSLSLGVPESSIKITVEA